MPKSPQTLSHDTRKLSDVVTISRQFLRSVRIDADLGREDALSGYICQGTASALLESMARQIQDTRQRAFTWTGPYGGGKSSLALVLCSLEGGRPYALTQRRFAGDWSSLQRGDVVEISVSCESLPQTLSGKLLAKRGSEAMNASAFELLVGTVLGRGTDTPYVLVECRDANQYVVNQRVFAGDWDALQQGDVLALAVTRGAAGRVLNARLAGSNGSSEWD